MAKLKLWKDKPRRKPLLLYGARQVGKTHLIKQFGAECFSGVEYFDLEKDPFARNAFSGSLDPEVIIANLSQAAGHAIDVRDTLIVFDEVQASNRALASLKYFCEDMPQAYVAAAGSLLGVAVSREGFSAPVGKVDAMTLRPMAFDEFLRAVGFASLVGGIEGAYASDAPYFMHERALELYRSYVLVGGMPEAVLVFAEQGDYQAVAEVQGNILDLYVADMAKYAQPYETARILEAWRSIPAQLAKENRKFQYKTVRSGGRASQYAAALAWLSAAGLVNVCTQVTSARLPLAAQENRGFFKVYMADTGLLSASMRMRPAALLDELSGERLDVGALTENYVAQALAANGVDLRYWVSAGTAEVDFVMEGEGSRAIPVEVKSSRNVRSRSLGVYREKYGPDLCLRLSTKNFGFENGIKRVPLYAAFCVGR